MRRTGLFLLMAFTVGIILAGCELIVERPVKQDHNVKPVVTVSKDANLEVAPFLTYFRYAAGLPADALAKECAQAENDFKERQGVVERINLAMLLGLAGLNEKRDEARAQRLLEGYLNDDTATNEALKDYAAFLRTIIIEQKGIRERNNVLEADKKGLRERNGALEAEQRGLKERYSALENKLREETARADNLQDKLDTLKAIESSILKRKK